MNQAPISPGLPAQALGRQDYLSSAAAAPGEQGFEGELTLALGGQVAMAPAEAVSAETDSELAANSDAGLQNMPVVLPWLPAMAANFSTSPAPEVQTAQEGASALALKGLAGSQVQAGQPELGAGAPVPGQGTGAAAVQPGSDSRVTQAMQTATLPAAAGDADASQLQAAPSLPTATSALQPDAAKHSLTQDIAAPTHHGLDTQRLAPASSASPEHVAALAAQPAQMAAAAPAQDLQQAQASPSAADLTDPTAQAEPIRPVAAANAAGPTGPVERAAAPTAQIRSAQGPLANPVHGLATQGVDQQGSASAPVSADPSASAPTHGPMLGHPEGARPTPAQTAASAAADAMAQPAVSGLPQAEHTPSSAPSSAPSEPAMARLGIEASPTEPAVSESADTAAEALQSQAAATPVSSEPSGTARAEPLSWSTSPVATSAGSGAVSSSQAQPALPPSVDMSLPIKPHWVSLESGAVQVEVLRMARDGGGQVTLELTPPDQGRYRLDLRIDDFGRASLVVEGASESMRTRLEMGESSLREQFAQMGLQLSLQMRSQQGQPDPGDAGSSSPAWTAGSDPAGGHLQSNSAPRRTVALDLERSLVRLYA